MYSWAVCFQQYNILKWGQILHTGSWSFLDFSTGKHMGKHKHTHMPTECLQVLLAHMHTPPDSSWTKCPWLCELPYGLSGSERDWPPLVGDWRGGATLNKSLARSSSLCTPHHWFPPRREAALDHFWFEAKVSNSGPQAYFGWGLVCQHCEGCWPTIITQQILECSAGILAHQSGQNANRWMSLWLTGLIIA